MPAQELAARNLYAQSSSVTGVLLPEAPPAGVSQ